MYVRPHPALLVALILVNYVGAFLLGFRLADWTAKKAFWPVVSGALLLQGLLVLLTWDRYSVVVTNKGPAQPLWSSPLGTALHVSLGLGGAAIGLLWWMARRYRLPSAR